MYYLRKKHKINKIPLIPNMISVTSVSYDIKYTLNTKNSN